MANELQPTQRVPAWLQLAVLALVGLAASSAYLTRLCIAVANTTIQRELHISEQQMGWVLAAFSGGYFLFQIPGGWLGNRIGTRTALSLISVVWSLMTVWTAAAGSWLALVASRAAFGAAQAGLVPLSAKIVRDWFRESLRGTCSAVVAAAMSLGGVVAMGLTAKLMLYFHWREVFYFYSLVGIVWALVFHVVFRTSPADHPWVALSAPRDDLPAKNQADDIDKRLETSPPALSFAARRTIVGINVQAFFRAAGYGMLVTWFPAFLEYRFQISPAHSGTLAMYPLVGVIAGTMLGGFGVDAILRLTGSKWTSRVGCAMAALGGAAAFTFAAATSDTASGFVWLMTLASFCSGFGNPAAWAATMDVSGRNTAVIVGMMNMSGTLGNFAMPVVLGYLIGDIRATGGNWNLVIYFVAAIYAAGTTSWLLVNPQANDR